MGGARVSRSHLSRVFQLQLLFVLLKAHAKRLQMLGVGGLQTLPLLLQSRQPALPLSRRLKHSDSNTDEWEWGHCFALLQQPFPPLSCISAGGCSAPSSVLPSASPASPRNRASASGVLLPGKVSTAEEQQWEWGLRHQPKIQRSVAVTCSLSSCPSITFLPSPLSSRSNSGLSCSTSCLIWAFSLSTWD